MRPLRPLLKLSFMHKRARCVLFSTSTATAATAEAAEAAAQAVGRQASAFNGDQYEIEIGRRRLFVTRLALLVVRKLSLSSSTQPQSQSQSSSSPL